MVAKQFIILLVFLAVGCGCGVLLKLVHPGKAAMKLSMAALSGAFGSVVGFNLVRMFVDQPGIPALSVGVVIGSLAVAYVYGLVVGGTGKAK
ncbi:MAG: hypothetical protein WBP72_11905 [Rhodocyclaceae bacterium]|jgi:hypothetical protein